MQVRNLHNSQHLIHARFTEAPEKREGEETVTDNTQQELTEKTVSFWKRKAEEAEKEFTADIENMSLEDYAAKRKSLGIKDLVNYDWN